MKESDTQISRLEVFRALIAESGRGPKIIIPSSTKDYIHGTQIRAENFVPTDADRERIAHVFEHWAENTGGRPLVLSEEKLAEIRFVRDFHVDWIERELNIDVSSRRPPSRKIHLYSAEEYDAANFDKQSKGQFTGPYAEIHIRSGPDEIYSLNHEIGHCLGHRRVSIEALYRSWQIFSYSSDEIGFSDGTNSWAMFTEYLVEAQNYLTFRAMSETTGFDYNAGAEMSYPGFCLYFDILLEDLSNRLQIPIDQILRYFMRCFITGDKSCLELFDVVYGSGSSDLVSKSGEKVYCTKLGLPIDRLIRNRQQYEAGRPVAMASLDGYEIQKSCII